MNNAIILAAYGSRHSGAISALTGMTERTRSLWPDVDVRLAYTSKKVRGHMERAGEEADSVEQALERLLSEGVHRVAIQSLHMIPGSEFHSLLSTANRFMLKKDGFDRVEVGFPLLASEDDIESAAGAIISVLPDRRKEAEAVLLMGHGTMHPGNDYYEGLNASLQQRDQNIFVGALEAEPGIESICRTLCGRGVKKAYLLPFLFGAGWHASKDMVGDKQDSWKCILEAAGIACEPVLKGAAEYEPLAEIWMNHLKEAMLRLERR